mmetsp:Transcript_20888/g.28740  ORF Transcript_20888/g.28740 Transcript_20888/m.28740 type:complete len:111 (-) Transcript_20888:737-1069(-)
MLKFRRNIPNTFLPLLTSKRDINNMVAIRGIPLHVDMKMLYNLANEYGLIRSDRFLEVPNALGKYERCYYVQFRKLNSAISMVDELDQTVLFGNRLVVEYVSGSFTKHEF